MTSSEDDDDPVVTVKRRKNRRLWLSGGKRECQTEDDARKQSDEDATDEDEEFAQHDWSHHEIAELIGVIETIELSVRNVPLDKAYIEAAEPSFSKLQSTLGVLAGQITSGKWQPEFLRLLKQSRMLRTRVIGRANKERLRENSGRCQLCGSKEHRCDSVLEFVGAPASASASASSASEDLLYSTTPSLYIIVSLGSPIEIRGGRSSESSSAKTRSGTSSESSSAMTSSGRSS